MSTLLNVIIVLGIVIAGSFLLFFLGDFFLSVIEAKRKQGFKVLECPIVKMDYCIGNTPIIYRTRTAKGGTLYLFGKKVCSYSYHRYKKFENS